MDFFKSVFSNDPDPPSSDVPEEEGGEVAAQEEEREGETSDDLNPNPNSPSGGGEGGGAWSFGGLIKTFASKSESVIQTYRRDLEEFGTGLKKETAALREAASRAVKDLPVSLEVGASVAQESLESVGQVIDEIGDSVWRGTAEIISQGKDTLLSMDADATTMDSDAALHNPGGSSKRYSRFEVQVLAIQSDPSTFSDEPEDLEDFQTWKSGFQLVEKEEEIESLCAENGALESILGKLVPQVVDYETFWSRYFYKVYKYKQAEDARASFVKRVISREEEEELSWEVDDEEEEEESKEGNKQEEQQEINATESNEEIGETSEPAAADEKPITKAQFENVKEQPIEKAQVDSVEEVVPAAVADEKVESAGKLDRAEFNGDNLVAKSEDKMLPEGKAEPGESCKDSDVSVVKSDDKMLPEGKAESGDSCKDSDVSLVSSQPSMQEEEDLEWDEIEDLGDHDEKKVGASGESPNKVDLRKRLSVAEEDDDLSWDIEDDESVKP